MFKKYWEVIVRRRERNKRGYIRLGMYWNVMAQLYLKMKIEVSWEKRRDR